MQAEALQLHHQQGDGDEQHATIAGGAGNSHDDYRYDVQQAIEAPRWLMGRTWGTRSRNMSLEGRISDEVVRELKRRRQPVQMVTDWNDIWVTHTSFKSIVNRASWKEVRTCG